MKEDNNGSEETIFSTALLLRTSTERAAYLDQACAGKTILRQRIEDLLGAEPSVGDFMEKSPLGRVEPTDEAKTVSSPLEEGPGALIGRYKLREKIGEGGCGVVYVAEQAEPVRRRVALKVIKLGMDTRQVIARFEAERQAVAMMDHPNIAKVLDAGTTEAGRPFFVMELVRGLKITEFCDKNHFDTRQRLDLFVQVCRAVQHAHQKGIIHRDLKPSNILVTENDGRAVPKIIDFGIAKATEGSLTDKTIYTALHEFIGTPAYMSPEQAVLTSLDIDTRSDIYSLGVLLYELLTGRTPFDAKELLRQGLDEVRRTIAETDPQRPSTRLSTLASADLETVVKARGTQAPKLLSLIRGDLDWIVMKALEKERSRRYDTANGLAMDIQHFLGNEPVLARPPSQIYRLQKLMRRHRMAFVAAGAIITALIGGAAVSTFLYFREKTAYQRAIAAEESQERLLVEKEKALLAESAARRRAQSSAQEARQNLYAADMKQANADVERDDLGHALELLNKYQPKPGESGLSDLRGFEWRYLWQQCQGDPHVSLPPVKGIVWWLDYSPDRKYMVAATGREVTVFDMASKKPVAHLDVDTPHGHVARCAAFTPDSRKLVTSSHDRLQFYETAHWTQLPEHLPGAGGSFAISPDGNSLATMPASDHHPMSKTWKPITIWNLRTHEVSLTLTNVDGPPVFSPDGKRLATDTPEGIKSWPLDPAAGSPILLEGSSNLMTHVSGYLALRKSMAFSPDGRFIAAGGVRDKILLWDSTNGHRVDNDQFFGHRNLFTCLAFSPDSKYLATSSFDSAILIWDIAARKRHRKLRGHLTGVWSLAFAPDGESLVSGGEDGTEDRVKVWPFNRTAQTEDKDFNDRWWPVWISTNGTELITFTDEKAEYWNTISEEPLYTLPRPGTPAIRDFSIALPSPDGRMVLAGRSNGAVHIGSFVSGDFLARSEGHTATVIALAVSPDGKALVSGGRDSRLCWWDLPSGRLLDSKLLAGAVTAVAFSPDSQMLVSASQDLKLRWWRCTTRDLADSTSLLGQTLQIVFSPDGKMLATGSSGNSRLWDVGTRSLRPGSIAFQDDIVFSPNSKMLLGNGFPQLLDVTEGKPLFSLKGHKQIAFGVAFSPDGRTIASAADDGTVRLWNSDTQQEMLAFSRVGKSFNNVMFSADGQTLAAGSEGPGQGGLRIWRAPSFDQIEVSEKTKAH